MSPQFHRTSAIKVAKERSGWDAGGGAEGLYVEGQASTYARVRPTYHSFLNGETYDFSSDLYQHQLCMPEIVIEGACPAPQSSAPIVPQGLPRSVLCLGHWYFLGQILWRCAWQPYREAPVRRTGQQLCIQQLVSCRSHGAWWSLQCRLWCRPSVNRKLLPTVLLDCGFCQSWVVVSSKGCVWAIRAVDQD